MARKETYTVVINGWSTLYTNREEAMEKAEEASLGNEDAMVKVYNSFHNCIWEN